MQAYLCDRCQKHIERFVKPSDFGSVHVDMLGSLKRTNPDQAGNSPVIRLTVYLYAREDVGGQDVPIDLCRECLVEAINQ